MPLISTIIPCYKQAHFLPQAVRSVLEQSLQDVEAVVVDDGSPDDPLAQLGELARDPRVVVVRQENRGLPAARNAGIAASHGTFLSFLDADDWLAPEFCQRLVPLLEHDGALGFVYCDVRRVFEDGGDHPALETEYSVGKSRPVVSGDILPSLLVGGYFTPNTVLMPRRVLGQVGLFDPALGGNADWDLWLRVAASGYPVRYVDERLAYYRIHGQNMSGNLEHMRGTRLATLCKLFHSFPEPAARAVGELCRSTEEQFIANQFLHSQLMIVDKRASDAQPWIATLQEAKDWHEQQSRRWQAEAERLQGIEQRFADYFRETQAWIASLEKGKAWLESEVAHWKSEAERMAAKP
jgi:glycosyltransferase involved in cell wall biosynthesis